MKRIGVISDTHMKRPDRYLEKVAKKHLKDVDMVIHAGDMVCLDVLDIFHEMGKNIIAVCGNMDMADVREYYPAKRQITIEGITIGITHGWGSPDGIRQRIRPSFDKVDAIVYGHTHQAFSGVESGILFFNPGSPTESRFTTSNSVGIIEVHDNNIKGEIITL